MPIVVILHSMVHAVYTCIRAYTIGLWFVIRHPIQFTEFIETWKLYRDQIAEVDAARASGFFDLNRATRRRLGQR